MSIKNLERINCETIWSPSPKVMKVLQLYISNFWCNGKTIYNVSSQENFKIPRNKSNENYAELYEEKYKHLLQELENGLSEGAATLCLD